MCVCRWSCVTPHSLLNWEDDGACFEAPSGNQHEQFNLNTSLSTQEHHWNSVAIDEKFIIRPTHTLASQARGPWENKVFWADCKRGPRGGGGVYLRTWKPRQAALKSSTILSRQFQSTLTCFRVLKSRVVISKTVSSSSTDVVAPTNWFMVWKSSFVPDCFITLMIRGNKLWRTYTSQTVHPVYQQRLWITKKRSDTSAKQSQREKKYRMKQLFTKVSSVGSNITKSCFTRSVSNAFQNSVPALRVDRGKHSNF